MHKHSMQKQTLNFYLQHCSINGLGSCSNEVVTSKVLATTNFDRSCFMLCRKNFDLFTCSTSLVLLYFSSFLVCQRECSSILYACYFSSFAMNVFAFIIRLLTDIWSPHKLNRNLMANLGPKCWNFRGHRLCFSIIPWKTKFFEGWELCVCTDFFLKKR